MNKVRQQIRNACGELQRGQPIYIHCGHFALFWKEGRLADCFEPGFDAPMAQQFAEFSARTLAQGVALAQALRAEGLDARLCTLVNDWQYIEAAKPLLSRAQQERKQYYTLLASHPGAADRLSAWRALDPSLFDSGSWQASLKSEAELRKRFVERVLKLDKDGDLDQLGLSKTRTPHGDPAYEVQQGNLCGAGLPDEICLVYGGNTNCAGEVIELLHEMREMQVQCFVNLYPIDCQNHVEVGTRLFHQLLGQSTPVPRIVNVGLGLSALDERERLDVY